MIIFNRSKLKPLCYFSIALLSSVGHVNAKSGDYLRSYQIGSQNWGSMSVKGASAYFGSDNGNFYALNLDRNRVAWQFETQGIVRSKAAIHNHKLFFTSDDGYLYALNRWSGTELWRVSLNDDEVVRNFPANHAPWDFDYTKSSPTVSNEIVYVGSGDNNLYAVDIDSGKIEWSFKANGMIRSTPTVYQKQVIFGSWDGSVYSLNSTTGDLSWKFETGGPIVSSPAVIDSKVIVGSRDTHVYALDVNSGKGLWQYEMPGGSWVESSATPSENGHAFYLGSSDANILLKIDATNGDVIWTFETKGWSWGKPLVKNGKVYIGAVGHDEPGWYNTESGFYSVDAASGSLLWQYKPKRVEGFVHGGVYASPSIVNGQVLVPDLDGYIHVFDE